MSDCRIFEISEGAEVWWVLAPSEWEARIAWFHSEKAARGYRTVERLLHNLRGKLKVRQARSSDVIGVLVIDELSHIRSLREVYECEHLRLSALKPGEWGSGAWRSRTLVLRAARG